MVLPESCGTFGPVIRLVTHSNRAAGEFFAFVRQRMRLKIVNHLQLMLNVAEKQICRVECIPFSAGEQLLVGKCLQRTERAAVEQRRGPFARQHLDRLHQEFDLPDAAGAELLAL